MQSMKNKSDQAFTFIELLVVITLVALLTMIVYPALAQTKPGVQRVYCSNNLKQVGIAFRTWAGRNADLFPMSVPNNRGGAAGAVGTARTANWTGGLFPTLQGVWGMFIVMSNELVTPRILYCPSESGVSHNLSSAPLIMGGTNFGPGTFNNAGFQNDYNVSYFVGVDANLAGPDRMLSGDHNLGTGIGQTTRVNQFISAGTNNNWTVNSIGYQDNNHRRQGNVLFVDGSVQNLTTERFRMALNRTGDTGRSPGVFTLAIGSQGAGVNRLQFP